MVDKRDRVIELIQYIESLGVSVNVCKNKARGNKGLFLTKNNQFYRIDISKSIDDENILSVLLHEFAHYIHYKYDRKLQSLNFVFEDLSEAELEELLQVTVLNVPKDAASQLYNTKVRLCEEVNMLAKSIKQDFPEFKKSAPFKPIEKSLGYPVKYLLKYDCIKYNNRIYSVDNLDCDFECLSKPQQNYIYLKSKQRYLSRLNAKINKLNKYYNNMSELWARFFSMFFTDEIQARKTAPLLSNKFYKVITNNKIKEITNVNKILQFVT